MARIAVLVAVAVVALAVVAVVLLPVLRDHREVTRRIDPRDRAAVAAYGRRALRGLRRDTERARERAEPLGGKGALADNEAAARRWGRPYRRSLRGR